MTADAEIIRAQLGIVARERRHRAADPALANRVLAVKAFQHQRFENTYSDLLANPRFVACTRFFLDDLYGPRDFTRRDEQFSRVVPALTRLFPQSVVATVATLAELHALSETLDSQMARHIDGSTVDAAAYRTAWQLTGRRDDRLHQINLVMDVGRALDRYTASPVLRHSLRVMRSPARAAGLGELQTFLERGFDTFRELRGAGEFLALISERERALVDTLFTSGDD